LESPPLPVRSIWRQIRHFAETIGEPPPRYGLVYDLIREIPVGLLTLAHRGGKTYSEKFDLVRQREAPRPNAISQADHAQLGIRLVREDGQIAKPWLTIVIDDYSRAIAGYFLGFDPPSSTRTALALRQAIWRKGHPHWQLCGIPEVLYTDNGSDFKSKHIEQVAVDLKIQLVFSTPGKPHGRGRIERFFRTVNEMFLCELDGFGKKRRRKPNLSIEQFEELFRTFLLRPTIDKPAPPQGRLPRRAGRKVDFCLACPSLSSSLICCSCKRSALGRCVAMVFTFTVCDIFPWFWPRTWVKMSPFGTIPVTWERSVSSTGIAFSVLWYPRSWQERPYLSGTSLERATNAVANSKRSSTIGNGSSIRFCN
jgi:transposase InsO family protein